MRNTKRLVSVLAVGTFSVCAYAQQKTEGLMTQNPGEIKWISSPRIPGVQQVVLEGSLDEAVPYIYRVKFPAGAVVPPHTHPHAERVPVVQGAFYIGQGEKVDEAKATPVSVGGLAIVQPKTPHFGLVKEETVIQLHGIGPNSIEFLDKK
jgi:quercetin dioxygenase-like cupin family protein